jgi:hypothetical protein
LERHGFSVWWDRRIPIGKTFDLIIEEALDAAKCVVVVWSNYSVRSEWVKNEAYEGIERQILIPVLIDDVRIPLTFRRIQAARLVGWHGEIPHPELELLIGSIKELLGFPQAEQQPVTKRDAEGQYFRESAKPYLRPLRVFLCHSSVDKPAVRTLYHQLSADGIDPWLDEENLLPGQNWQQEIPKAVRASDIVLVCLSKGSILKTGYIQKEIRYVLDTADEQPEGSIYLIPLMLEDVKIPERLSHWHWIDLYKKDGYAQLMKALRAAARQFGLIASTNKPLE